MRFGVSIHVSFVVALTRNVRNVRGAISSVSIDAPALLQTVPDGFMICSLIFLIITMGYNMDWLCGPMVGGEYINRRN